MYIIFVVCGYLSTVFALITQLPQVITIIKHRSGKNLSYPYLTLIMVDCIMYVLYGIGFLLDNNQDGIPIILSGTIPFIITLLLLILKIYFNVSKIKKKDTETKIENSVKEICDGITDAPFAGAIK